MNTLENFITSKTTFRVSEVRSRDDRGGRAFGRDITNIEKRTSNISFVEKPVKKCEVIRIRSGSLRHCERPSLLHTTQLQTPVAQTRDVLREYENDFAKSLRELDVPDLLKQCCCAPSIQIEVTERMRGILIDWLVDVHGSFKLLDQTLHLSLRYLDEFLSRQKVSKQELQLVGVACILLASKFEEIYPPRICALIDISANTYSAQQIKEMEFKISDALHFQFIKTTSFQVLELCLKRQINEKFGLLCKFLLEMAYTDGVVHRFRPSVIAFAAINLANAVLKTEHPNLERIREPFDITTQELVRCFKELFQVLGSSPRHNLKAIRKKYASEKYQGVSKLRLDLST